MRYTVLVFFNYKESLVLLALKLNAMKMNCFINKKKQVARNILFLGALYINKI